MTDNNQQPYTDIPEDDPLAPWRPDAPWPEEEKELWEQLLGEAGGDSELALQKAWERAKGRLGDPENPTTLTLWSLVTRRSLTWHAADGNRVREAVNSLAFLLVHTEGKRSVRLMEEAVRLSNIDLGHQHPDTLLLLNNLGLCLRVLGDVRRALPIFVELFERFRALLGNYHSDTLDVLNNVAYSHGALGDERRALPLYEQVLERRRAVLGEDHPDTLTVLSNLAGCHGALGDRRRALPLLEQALERFRAVLGEDHPDTLTVLSNLAGCHGALGDERRPLPLYERVLERRRAALGEDHPDTLISLNSLASCHLELGDVRRALQLHKQALERCRFVLGENHPDTLISLSNLAFCHEELGDVRRALPLYRQALEGRQAVLGEDHPDTLMSLHNLANCHETLGDVVVSKSIRGQLVALLGQERDRGEAWLKLVQWTSRSIGSRESSGHPISWRSPSRQISRAFLEDLDLTDPENVEHILGPFREFHGNWLRLCLADGAAEEIPHVISAIQGREMAAMLLSELEAGEANWPAGDPRKLYLEVVRELRQLRLMLRHAEKRDQPGGCFDGDLYDGNRRFQMDAEASLRQAEQRHAVTDQLRERYGELLEQMKDLRGQIADLDETFRLAYAPPDVSVEMLSQRMAADEAKVLLFQHAREDGAEPVPHACCITADGRAEVLVLERMPTVREAMNAAGLRGTARMGMRGGGRGAAPLLKKDVRDEPDEADASSAEPQADLAALMGEALWQPLRQKYPQVTSWHLATHQDLHVLPVALGLDPAHTTTVHPGLLFLARKQEDGDAANDNVPSRVVMHSDPAAGTDAPIPFVEAEVELVRLIWGGDRVAVSGGEETLERLNEPDPPLDALLLAAHGDELDGEPPQTIVWLDREGGRMLDTNAVLSSGQRPHTVIASACVAGRVTEDSLGEPLGLVSAFFLHGARFVLAPLQPVADMQMPIVMGLFHRAWRESGDPRRAWQVARQQALTGQWPEGYAEQLRAAYGPVMRAMLERAVKEQDHIYSVILRAGWNIGAADRAGLHAFEDEDSRAIENRKVLIDRLVEDGIGQILAERTRAAEGRPSAAIRHICDWTMPFGS